MKFELEYESEEVSFFFFHPFRYYGERRRRETRRKNPKEALASH